MEYGRKNIDELKKEIKLKKERGENIKIISLLFISLMILFSIFYVRFILY